MEAPSITALSGLVDELIDIDRAISVLQAQRVELLARTHEWAELEAARLDAEGLAGEVDSASGWSARTIAHRTAASELAAALRTPERTIVGLMAEASLLVTDLPHAMDALRAGTIGYRHASRLVEEAMPLSSADRRDLDARLAPDLAHGTAAQLGRRAHRLRERLHPESIVERVRSAQERRRVAFEPDEDGMGWLNAYIALDAGRGILNRLDALAADLAGPGESRTRDQIRADALVDLLCDAEVEGLPRGVRATVAITVPVLTLLGHSDEPAELEGRIPIDPGTARELAATAPSFTRILTHPETGAVLSLGRTKYRPPADLLAWVQLRDETCRHPGCNEKAVNGDIDHTIPASRGGPTNHDNLGALCRKHHLEKHRLAWRLSQPSPGVFRWTSPTGRVYTELPEGLRAA